MAHAPIHSVEALRVTVQRTVSLVHGAYSGVADSLPDTSVVSIVQCRQGDTVYVPGDDYRKSGDKVDWSPTGNEPATGSTYECTYTVIVSQEPEAPDLDGFTVAGGGGRVVHSGDVSAGASPPGSAGDHAGRAVRVDQGRGLRKQSP